MKKNNISNTFIEVFEPTMLSRGFVRKGRDFHRIVNGKIAQCVSYFKRSSDPEFTIQFAIVPLCLEFEFSTPLSDAWRLTDSNQFSPAFPFLEYYGNPEGYVDCMPLALKTTVDILLPKMDTEIDYESYYKCYRNSMSKVSNERYLFALLFEDYEDANMVRESVFEQWRGANMRKFGIEHNPIPKQREYYGKIRDEYNVIKEAIDNNDRRTIEEYLHNKEQKSLNSYAETYGTKKQYQKYLEDGTFPFEFVKI